MVQPNAGVVVCDRGPLWLQVGMQLDNISWISHAQHPSGVEIVTQYRVMGAGHNIVVEDFVLSYHDIARKQLILILRAQLLLKI